MTGTVSAGRYVLEVGAPPGTLVSSPAQPQKGDPRPLRRAFKKGGDGGKLRKETAAGPLADVVGEASEAMLRAERAVALFRAVVEGNVLDPKLLSSEIDSLLALLERLDRGERWEEALRLGRALSGLLALTLRWVELVRSLNIALEAADKLGDSPAVAWAKHELGTLHLAAEDPAGANRELGEAREIRRRLRDRSGLATTERNLQVLCQQLRQLLRDGTLVQRRAVLRAVLAVAVGLLLVAGVAAAVVSSRDDTQPPLTRAPAQCTNQEDDDGDGLVDGDDPGCASADDDDESDAVPQACADGQDNDADGLVDGDDPGCTSTDDDDESDAVPQACADGQDNDADGLIDGDDPGCTSTDDDDESDAVLQACADRQDNDADGLIDFGDDPGCTSTDDVDETDPPVCDDGIDNDSDTLIDGEDPGCTSADDDNEASPNVE
jgi:hypothetical protein